jgi:hypothetical protein
MAYRDTTGAGAAPLHPAPPERRQLQHLEAAKGRKHETVKVHGSLSSNDGDVVLGWALDGHGILLRSEWDAAKYLDSGRLQVVLPDYTLPSADLYAYYPSRQQQPAGCAPSLIFWLRRYRQPLRHAPGEFRDDEEPEQRRAGGGERPDHPRGEQEPGDAVSGQSAVADREAQHRPHQHHAAQQAGEQNGTA